MRAFHLAQTQKLRVAHHQHVPAQIIRAVKLNIPTIVLVRHPKDAVISWLIYDSTITINQGLRSYISFHETLYPYKSMYVVAPFQEVISNFESVVNKVNRKFDSNFHALTPQGIKLDQVFSDIKNTTLGNLSRVPCPSSSRKADQKRLKQELEKTKYKKLLQEAESVYKQFVSE